jgi:BirA family transcriptional regulator, biotin operon repressor / biotin---[acetyl-CoA-carboxylase] ligase
MGPVKVLGQDSLEHAVRAAGIDVPPVWLEETGSTNAETRALADRGAQPWTVVAAGHQTAGRGRLGRSWSDAPGKALMFSVLLRPDLTGQDTPLVALLAAVEMIAAMPTTAVRAKWPNDLMVGDRKLGGVLSEARLVEGRPEHVVVGVGLNVYMAEDDFPPEIRAKATSLLLQGTATDAQAILTGFLAGLRRNALDPAQIVHDYRAVCDTLGRPVRATSSSGDIIEGLATGIDRYGGLVLEWEGSRSVVAFGEVVRLD